MIVRLSFGNMIGIFFTQNNPNSLLNLINLITLIKLLINNIINNHINILQLPQQSLKLPFQTLIKLPKFLMLNKRTTLLTIT